MHGSSLFLTPTYSPENLPADLSVSKRTHQLFMKRVRHRFGPVRFFGCGEYGGGRGRPHYHTIIFGLEAPDRIPWMKSPAGSLLYRSPSIDAAWGLGHCLIGDVTMESAAYVARYTVKKVTGPAAEDHYRRAALDPETGEIRSWEVEPEFLVMSRRPGLGSLWFERYAGDCFPKDFITVNGRKVPVPPFYRSKLSEAEQLRVVVKRKQRARLHASNNTERRLLTRHESQELRAKRLLRSFDEVL